MRKKKNELLELDPPDFLTGKEAFELTKHYEKDLEPLQDLNTTDLSTIEVDMSKMSFLKNPTSKILIDREINSQGEVVEMQQNEQIKEEIILVDKPSNSFKIDYSSESTIQSNQTIESIFSNIVRNEIKPLLQKIENLELQIQKLEKEGKQIKRNANIEKYGFFGNPTTTYDIL